MNSTNTLRQHSREAVIRAKRTCAAEYFLGWGRREQESWSGTSAGQRKGGGADEARRVGGLNRGRRPFQTP